MAKKKAAATTAELTLQELEQFAELERQRTEHERLAEAFKREGERLKLKIRAYVEGHGGSDRTCVHHGFVCALKSMGSRPDWKGAYTELAGAEAAVALMEKTPKTYRVEVTRAAAT
jgi:hypothetical protein